MTEKQKIEIVTMRRDGEIYKDIAAKLGLSINTVKSYCRRVGVTVQADIPSEASDLCRECGKPINQNEKTKRRIFCCKSCREKWWAKHPEMVKRRAVYNFICPTCKKKFTAYGNNKRKYCSHGCYVLARFGGDAYEQANASS